MSAVQVGNSHGPGVFEAAYYLRSSLGNHLLDREDFCRKEAYLDAGSRGNLILFSSKLISGDGWIVGLAFPRGRIEPRGRPRRHLMTPKPFRIPPEDVTVADCPLVVDDIKTLRVPRPRIMYNRTCPWHASYQDTQPCPENGQHP